VHAANQVVDATKSPTTYIEATANGVDLINIANPNSVGVSINHYKKFNVVCINIILGRFFKRSIILTLKNLIGEGRIPV
jgi:hypothetical protein